jgi:hypothetical protein
MSKLGVSLLLATMMASVPVVAQDKKDNAKRADKPHSTAEVQKDIQDHLAMADAHTAAAKCLQSGKGEKVCHEQLAKECKGLGIGKLCGMRHKH